MEALTIHLDIEFYTGSNKKWTYSIGNGNYTHQHDSLPEAMESAKKDIIRIVENRMNMEIKKTKLKNKKQNGSITVS